MIFSCDTDGFVEKSVFSTKVGLFSALNCQDRPKGAFLRKCGLVWQLCEWSHPLDPLQLIHQVYNHSLIQGLYILTATALLYISDVLSNVTLNWRSIFQSILIQFRSGKVISIPANNITWSPREGLKKESRCLEISEASHDIANLGYLGLPIFNKFNSLLTLTPHIP